MTPQEKEKLEVLNGDRGDKQNAAVRLKHVQALLGALPVEPSGDAAADIRAIYAALNAMRAVLR
jgi:hypothetical protein